MNKKAVSKNPKPKPNKTIQKDLKKIPKGNLNTMCSSIITILVSFCVGMLTGYLTGAYFFKRSVSKKDFEPVGKGVNRIEQDLSQLRQDILGNNDYKSYLEMFQVLYRSILEKSFPGGYMTFGLRDNSIFGPTTFSNKNIHVDIGSGSINFKEKDCSIKININRINFVETQNTISNISVGVYIKNYEIGALYQAFTLVTKAGWKQNVAILSDDIRNPVFVYGFAK